MNGDWVPVFVHRFFVWWNPQQDVYCADLFAGTSTFFDGEMFRNEANAIELAVPRAFRAELNRLIGTM